MPTAGWLACESSATGKHLAGRQDRARKEPLDSKFRRQSLTNPAADGWAVIAVFDQFAGATITPRAVVGAVHRALQYFDAHKAELLAAEGATADAAGNALKAAANQTKPPCIRGPAPPRATNCAPPSRPQAARISHEHTQLPRTDRQRPVEEQSSAGAAARSLPAARRQQLGGQRPWSWPGDHAGTDLF